MAVRLTNDQSVGKLTPRLARYVVFDSKIPGLQLRVTPDGVKTWSFRYRANGRHRRLTLGEYDRVTLAGARAAAVAELRKVDGGRDPQAERREARAAAERAKADSVDALCTAYIDRHAKPKKRSWRADQGLINAKILPKWKGRPVSSLTRWDCRDLVNGIAKQAPIVANRVAALLSRLLRFAVDEELIDVNPAAQLPKPGVEARQRPEGERESKPYDDDEIRALWQATEGLDAAPRAIYRLGLLTGQRPGEILDLRWAEMDGAWWTLPAGRSKNRRDHRIYLTQPALDELSRVPRTPAAVYVFANYRGKRQQAVVNRLAFAGVRRRLRPRHALRDTVVTRLAQAGVPVETIARVVNHSYGPAVTAGYNAYSYDVEKRRAMERWARDLSRILAGESFRGAEIVPLQMA